MAKDTEALEKENKDLLKRLEDVSKRIAVIENNESRASNYKEVLLVIERGIKQTIENGRFREVLYEQIRNLTISQGDWQSILRKQAETSTILLWEQHGGTIVENLLSQSPKIVDIVNRQWNAAFSQDDFITALSKAFFSAISDNPAVLKSVVEAVCNDPDNKLGKSLSRNNAFVTATTLGLLTKMRDALA